MEHDFDAMMEEILWPSLIDENEDYELSDEDGDPSVDSDYDPTPYCSWCGAKTAKNCDCGPISPDD